MVEHVSVCRMHNVAACRHHRPDAAVQPLEGRCQIQRNLPPHITIYKVYALCAAAAQELITQTHRRWCPYDRRVQIFDARPSDVGGERKLQRLPVVDLPLTAKLRHHVVKVTMEAIALHTTILIAKSRACRPILTTIDVVAIQRCHLRPMPEAGVGVISRARELLHRSALVHAMYVLRPYLHLVSFAQRS